MAFLAVTVCAAEARAADLSTEVTREEVGVGESFQVQLSVPLDEDEQPSDPKLPVDGPAEVRGPSMGSSRSITMHNFSFSSQTKLVITWTLTATGKGKITIGPGSIRLGKRRLKGEEVVVTVTDEPPRRRRVIGRDPFDDFFSGDPFDMLRGRTLPRGLPPPPTGLVPETAPDKIGFLRAQLSKSEVVVGQTVVLTIYAFGSRGSYQEANPVEPSLANFLTFREVQSSFEEQRYQAEIDGRDYQIAKLRQIVLVPLRAGELQIGPMRAILAGQGYPARDNPIGYPVASQELTLRVHEAPSQDRPKEFAEGNVGQFKMKVELHPTELVEGEYAELLVHLSGNGNLPTRVSLPEGPAWEWQDPSTVGEPEVQNGELVGLRTLKIPVRVTRPGELELGKVRLPYFDPELEKYAWLEATLPKLHVKPRPAPPPSAASPKPAIPAEKGAPNALDLTAFLSPRPKLGPLKTSGALAEALWPVSALAPPLAFGLYGIALGLQRWASRRKRNAVQAHPGATARKLVKQLSRSKAGPETRAQFRKAIDQVLLARLKKTSRSFTANELRLALEADGVAHSDAEDTVKLLDALDRSEFAGSAELLERILNGRKGNSS
jgi:hypothetical protein